MVNNSLGCGEMFKNWNGKQRKANFKDCDFICGLPNAWGKETLCKECDLKLRKRWKEEEERRKTR